jgi:hypothetical protein
VKNNVFVISTITNEGVEELKQIILNAGTDNET